MVSGCVGFVGVFALTFGAFPIQTTSFAQSFKNHSTRTTEPRAGCSGQSGWFGLYLRVTSTTWGVESSNPRCSGRVSRTGTDTPQPAQLGRPGRLPDRTQPGTSSKPIATTDDDESIYRTATDASARGVFKCR